MARQIIAARIGYRDNTASPNTSGTVYVATDWFNDGSTQYEGRLSRDISFKFEVAPPYTGRKPAAGIGRLLLRNEDGGIDDWFGWEFRDGTVELRMLDVGDAWADGTTLAVAVVEDIIATGEDEVQLTLRDNTALLEQPLAQEVWEGPGFFEDAAGKVQPVCFGTPLNVPTINVVFESFRYDFSDVQIVDVDEVRIDGKPQTGYIVEGTDSGAVSGGVTLAAQPDGQVTVDPVATGTSNAVGFTINSPQTAGITFSNLNKTMQNENRNFFSPAPPDQHTALGGAGRSLADGGKYYFELLVNRGQNNSANYNSTYGYFLEIATGICTASVDQEGFIDQADMYSLGLHSGDDIVTFEDTTEIDNTDTTLTGNDGDDALFGVLVDFDAGTVQFRVHQRSDPTRALIYTSSLLTITANSPNDTFFPFGTVVGATGATDVRSQDNKITIRTQPEDFEVAIPSGYEAWSGSAYAATTQFSDLVASITSRISGITVDATTEAEIDALGYSYSYFCPEGKSASQVLWEACRSFTGWFYPDRNGALRFGRLRAPAGSVVDYDETNIIQIVRYELDRAKGLSNRMGGLKNWTVQGADGLDTTISEEERDRYSREFQYEVSDTVSSLSQTYAHAETAKLIGTYFRTQADVNTEVARLASLFTQDRYLLELDVAFSLTDYAALTLGDSIGVDLTRLGLSGGGGSGAFSTSFDSGFDITGGGGQFLVLAIEGNFKEPVMRLKVWG